MDTVAGETKPIHGSYEVLAIILAALGGDIVPLHAGAPFYAVLDMAGGNSHFWESISYEGGLFAEHSTYGITYTRSSRDGLLNSHLIRGRAG